MKNKFSLTRQLSWLFAATFLACGYSLVLPNASAAISIDFAGSNTTAMASSETAGVVPKGNWNNASGASSASPLKLVDDTGAATNVSAAWTSDNTWNTTITDVAGNNRMMRGYLDNGSGKPATVTITGLTAGTYSIYVYADGDNASFSHTGVYQISGAGMTTASTSLTDAPNTNFSGTFIPAANSTGNYVLFGNVTVASGFTLTATPGATGNVPRAPVNGIQIIPISVPTPDFTIAATPSSQTATAGTSKTYTVTVGAVNGFVGTASLSASGLPAGATASFNPAAITGSGSSTLTVTTIGSTPAGTSALTFKGISGSLTHSAVATLVVSAAPSPVALSINFAGMGTTLMASTETAGAAPKANWNNATGASSSSALSLVSETGSATGASATWTSDNTWNTTIADVAGNNRMMRGYLDNGNGNPSTVTVSGVIPGKYNIYVYMDGDNTSDTLTGIYRISGAGIATASITETNAANTMFGGAFTQANNSNGNYVMFSGVSISSGFTLTATPGATTSVPRAPVNGIQIVPAVPDFSMVATPGAQTVMAGGKATWTVAVGALNGFNGTVNLTASGMPAGTSVSFSPASMTGSGSMTATVTTSATTPAATSTVTISGTSGSMIHTAMAPLTVGVNQPPTVSAGSAQAITLPATAQLSGTAADDGLPNGTLTYSWKVASGPGTVTFGNVQSLSTTASFSAAGTYVLGLTASDSVLTSSATCTITVSAAPAVTGTPDVVYPANAGVFNVKNYGAMGDGVTDDTGAIRAAMYDAWNKQGNIVYFPAGTYIVSDTLTWKDQGGTWRAWLGFQGQNQATTKIKLKDSSSGYGVSNCNPMYAGAAIGCKAVIYTASNQETNPIGAGESSYITDVRDLTIDTGAGNPAAQGIDWTASNTAAIRNVTVIGSGRVGVNTSRGWGGGGNGPALVKNLTVNGSFDYGVVSGSGEVGLTFEHIIITNSNVTGFWNQDQNAWIRDLNVTTAGSVPAVVNAGSGNMSLIDSKFTGSGGQSAIQNSTWLFARNITSSGFASAVNGVSGTSVSEYSSNGTTRLFPAAAATSMNLPISETPTPFADSNFANWAVVTSYGASPNGGDATAAIQNALNAGKPTVFFPAGAYYVSGTLHIPSGVRRLLGVASAFTTNGSASLECDATSGGAVEIRSFSFAGNVSVLNNCTVPLVIADVFNLSGYSNTPGTGLTVYFENAAIPNTMTQHGGNAWARQLDVENDVTHVVNDGAKFWCLGYKTEGTGATGSGQGLWYTQNGGSTEIIGAFNSTPGPGNYFGYFTVNAATTITGLSSGYDRTVVLTETRSGTTTTYSNIGNRYGGTAITLYSGR